MSWTWWVAEILTLMAGGCFGLLLASLLVAASDADDEWEDL